MNKSTLKEEIEIPEGVTVTYDKGVFTVKGEKGENSRKLYHPRFKTSVEGNKVVFEVPKSTQNDKKLVFTYRAHLKNMFKGVQEGVTYKLKVCSSHFPMTVAFNNQTLEIKNFIGGRHPRNLKLNDQVQVKVEGDIITLEGIDKEVVGQAAASIEKVTRRPGFDKRIFQDGIYIIEKDGKVLV